MARNRPRKAELMLVTVEVETGKVLSVDGVETENVEPVREALKRYGYPAPRISDYEQVRSAFSKPSDNCAVILHTRSSPGCSWVMQDGWWRKVCN